MNNKSTTLRTYLFSATALAITACGGGSEGEQTAAEAPAADMASAPAGHDLAALLASESRPEADRARDAGRKPADVIAFLGIEPGMSVIDVMAASGYYTEVLSLAVGPDGHVASHNQASTLQRRDGAVDKALSDRLANDRLPNVSRLNKELDELSANDGPFDAALTALNLHDVYNNRGDEAAIGMLKSIYATLKPGGIFGVIDHAGVGGNDNKALHRMQKTDAIRLAEAAGFIVEGDGSVLRNINDDMTLHMRTEGLRGNTNRFLLKLRKPET